MLVKYFKHIHSLHRPPPPAGFHVPTVPISRSARRSFCLGLNPTWVRMCDPGLAQPGLFGGVLVGLWTVVSEDLIPGLSAEWPSRPGP
jgi:hypothetical protein